MTVNSIIFNFHNFFWQGLLSLGLAGMIDDKFFSSCKLKLDLDFLPGLSDLFVSESSGESYVFHILK